MSFTRERISNGRLGVDIRRNPTDSWDRHNFTRVYRRQRSGNWERLTSTVIWICPDDMYMTRMTPGGAHRAILFVSIATGNVRVHYADWRPAGGRWEITLHRQHTLDLPLFMNDISHRQRVAGLRLAQRLSVAVAICTGMTMAVGFGPLAGAFGLSANMGTTTTFIVGALSNAIATFIHRNFQAMSRAVQADSEHGAARYFLANTTDFRAILSDSLISGAAGGATSLIPSPSGASSLRDVVGHVLNRAANNIASQIQTVVQHFVNSQTGAAVPSVQSIQSGLQTDAIMAIAMRSFG